MEVNKSTKTKQLEQEKDDMKKRVDDAADPNEK